MKQELTNFFCVFTFTGYNYIFTIPVNSTGIVITQYGWKNREDSSYLGKHFYQPFSCLVL